jgi:hypothetical protein
MGYWSWAGKNFVSILSAHYCRSVESKPSVGNIVCWEIFLPDLETLTNVGAKSVPFLNKYTRVASLAVLSILTKFASPKSPVPVRIAGAASRLAASWTLAAVSSGSPSLRM